ncbi:hypothetical protein ACEPAI_8848 [Sanghuangporus weigelae]
MSSASSLSSPRDSRSESSHCSSDTHSDGSINADPNILKLFINIFTELQKAGGTASDDQLWSFLGRHTGIDLDTAGPPEIKETTRTALLDILTVMGRVKAMRSTLNDLSQALERKVNTVKLELGPSFLHCGVLATPDEILKCIFRNAKYDEENEDENEKDKNEKDENGKDENEQEEDKSDAALVLSHVCSRFRSILLSTPLLWSRLSSQMSASQLDAHIERAGDSSLSAVVDIRGPSQKVKQFSGFIAKHASRWKAIKFVGPNSRMPITSDFIQELHLPNLEYFDSRVKFRKTTLEAWTMPKSKSIRLLETIPRAESKLFNSNTIQSVVFSSPRDCYDTELLIEFLTSLPNLTDLHLDIEAGSSEEDRVLCDDTSLDELPNLKQLTLKTSVPKVFSAVLIQLGMPMLEKLDIIIHDEVSSEYDNYYSPSNWMSNFPSEPCPSVKWLHLSFRNEHHEGLLLYRLFTVFSGLEHLSLDIPDNQPSMFMGKYSHELPEMPPLRSLTMQVPSEAFIEDFADAMEEGDRWEDFECLYFKPAGLMSRTQAEYLLTKQKMEWYE